MAKVLIIGSGGRESALGVKMLASSEVDQVYVAPGNAGMAYLGLTVIDIALADHDRLIHFAQQNQVALTVVGPEAALATGIVDAFEAAKLPIFGVNRQLAQMETSKSFAKAFMEKYQLPTAKSQVVAHFQAATAALADFDWPVVIKVDGLAAGKGVTIAADRATALATLEMIYQQDPNMVVVIEQYLQGQELSVTALFSEQHRVILPMARDHKRRFDDQKGPNTGGMGAYSPAPGLSEGDLSQAEDLVDRTLAGFAKEGYHGHGVMYIGLMMTAHGPYILEYNMRFGDPETQVILPQIQNDFFTLLRRLKMGQPETLRLNGQTYVTVVAVDPQYPQATDQKFRLTPETFPPDSQWLPAAVWSQAGQWYGLGGRIYAIVSHGDTLAEASEAVYEALSSQNDGLDHRHDIGTATQ